MGTCGTLFRIGQEKNPRKQAPEVPADCSQVSVEVAWSALDALAFGAFSDVFDSAILEKGFHRHFAATRAVETVGRTGCTRVLAD